MPIEKIEDEVKRPEDQPPPITEVILAQQRDPDEASFAEQNITSFIRDRLAEWTEQMNASVDGLESWVYAHPAEQQSLFSSNGFFDFMGERFLGELFGLAGGKGTPIMDTVAQEVSGAVTNAVRDEHEIGFFLEQLRRGVRDACWYVRDASPSILSAQWPALLDLAYEGSYDFVPLLHTLGLPTRNFAPALFSQKLVGHADGYENAVDPMRQQARDMAPTEEKKQEIAEETKQLDEITADKKSLAI